jgi:hypothetical protein
MTRWVMDSWLLEAALLGSNIAEDHPPKLFYQTLEYVPQLYQSQRFRVQTSVHDIPKRFSVRLSPSDENWYRMIADVTFLTVTKSVRWFGSVIAVEQLVVLNPAAATLEEGGSWKLWNTRVAGTKRSSWCSKVTSWTIDWARYIRVYKSNICVLFDTVHGKLYINQKLAMYNIIYQYMYAFGIATSNQTKRLADLIWFDFIWFHFATRIP